MGNYDLPLGFYSLPHNERRLILLRIIGSEEPILECLKEPEITLVIDNPSVAWDLNDFDHQLLKLYSIKE